MDRAFDRLRDLQAASEECRGRPVTSDGEWLSVVTGFPDDQRRVLRPEDTLYPLAALARSWQDSWSAEFHMEFWEGLLKVWPRPGRPSTQQSVAFILMCALNFRIDPTEVLERLGYQRNDGRWQEWRRDAYGAHHNIFRRAPCAVLLPRVVTPSEEMDIDWLTAVCNVRVDAIGGAPTPASADLILKGNEIIRDLLYERGLRLVAGEEDDTAIAERALIDAAAAAVKAGESTIKWPHPFPPPLSYRVGPAGTLIEA